MKRLPQSCAELKDALAAIFPGLPRDFGAWGESVLESAGPTPHSLLREFALHFERNAGQFPERQLRRFAELTARCLEAGGTMADAFATCIVEPLRDDPGAARFMELLRAARAG